MGCKTKLDINWLLTAVVDADSNVDILKTKIDNTIKKQKITHQHLPCSLSSRWTSSSIEYKLFTIIYNSHYGWFFYLTKLDTFVHYFQLSKRLLHCKQASGWFVDFTDCLSINFLLLMNFPMMATVVGYRLLISNLTRDAQHTSCCLQIINSSLSDSAVLPSWEQFFVSTRSEFVKDRLISTFPQTSSMSVTTLVALLHKYLLLNVRILSLLVQAIHFRAADQASLFLKFSDARITHVPSHSI